ADVRRGRRPPPPRGGSAARRNRAGTGGPALVDTGRSGCDAGRARTGASRRGRQGARPAPTTRAGCRGRRVPVQGFVALRAGGRGLVLRPGAPRRGPAGNGRERALCRGGRRIRGRAVVT